MNAATMLIEMTFPIVKEIVICFFPSLEKVMDVCEENIEVITNVAEFVFEVLS